MHCSRRLTVQTLVFTRSYLYRQVSPPETLAVKGGTTWAKMADEFCLKMPRNIQGSFTCRKSRTRDKRLYFPSEGRRAEDFFALKNPTASAASEPANLGTKGQHATSRPSRPLSVQCNSDSGKNFCVGDVLKCPSGINTSFRRSVQGDNTRITKWRQ